jgi:hypothetical protein
VRQRRLAIECPATAIPRWTLVSIHLVSGDDKFGARITAPGWGKSTMNLVILVVILLILFGGGGFYYGGPYVGGGLGTVLLIVLIVLLLRG